MSEQGPDRIVEPRLADDSTSWQNASDSETWISQVLPGILAVAFVIVVALAVAAGERALMNSARQTNASTLQSVLSNTVQRFEAWAQNQEDHGSVWLDNPELIATVRALHDFETAEQLAAAQPQRDIRMRLDSRVAEYGYRGFELVDANGRVVSAMEGSRLGLRREDLSYFGRGYDGIRLTTPRILDGPRDSRGPDDRASSRRPRWGGRPLHKRWGRAHNNRIAWHRAEIHASARPRVRAWTSTTPPEQPLHLQRPLRAFDRLRRRRP